MKKIKIARVFTIPFSFISLLGLLDRMSQDTRYEVHIISSYDPYLDHLKLKYKNITFHSIKIPRKISLRSDVRALFELYKIYRKEHFIIVHSHTPKAGLLSAIAGFLSLTPVRLHTFTGQVWVDYRGIKKYFFKKIDWLICLLNTTNYADSFSQKEFLIKNKVTNPDKMTVLHRGSFAGIDLNKFSIEKTKDSSKKLKDELFPGFAGKIILYLGRINNDKGLSEIYDAFYKLKLKFNLKLLVVGPEDKLTDELEKKIIKLKQDKDACVVGFVNNTEDYFGACDIYCLPSYREGCPTSVIEASAMGKAVIVSNIYGTSDLVQNQITGLVFEVRNTNDLVAKIEELLINNEQREQMGKNGAAFAREHFSQDLLTDAMIAEYEKLVLNI